MAIIVVGGGGRGAGKTALVCGLIARAAGDPWTAVKITTHEHGKADSDLGRDDAGAGDGHGAISGCWSATRAVLVTAGEGATRTSGDELAPIVDRILRESPSTGSLIFESNSVLAHVRPDVCLCAASSPWAELKASYDLVLEHADASVELAGHDHIIEAEKITFRLASLERVSPVMLEWVRERLSDREP